MRYLVKNSSINDLKKLVNHNVNFKSDCIFFPNFNVTGKVNTIKINKSGNAIINITENTKHKQLDIDSNMSNLSYEII